MWQRFSVFAEAPLTGIDPATAVVVEPGDSLRSVLRKLRQPGVSEGRSTSNGSAGWQLGAAGKLQVGEYALEPGSTPRALLLAMRDGKVIQHRFTIVEGWNFRELRAALAQSHTAGARAACWTMPR